jgi:hypothetical protein
MVWRYLFRGDVKWLTRVEGATAEETGQIAIVVDKADRHSPAFSVFAESAMTYDIRGREPAVEEILDRYSVGVVPMSTAAVFTGKQEIREGWLKLRRTKDR